MKVFYFAFDGARGVAGGAQLLNGSFVTVTRNGREKISRKDVAKGISSKQWNVKRTLRKKYNIKIWHHF